MSAEYYAEKIHEVQQLEAALRHAHAQPPTLRAERARRTPGTRQRFPFAVAGIWGRTALRHAVAVASGLR